MSATPDNLRPEEDTTALEDEARALLKRAGLRKRDLTLEPAEEEHLRAIAVASLEKTLSTPPRRIPRLLGSIRYWWLVVRTLDIRRDRWLVAAIPAAATALATVAVVVGLVLSGAPTPAVAVTPPMPVFSGVEEGMVPLRGEDATPMLHQLAERAAAQPDEPIGEVQFVDIAGWWIDTNPDTGKAEASGGLMPASVQLYTLADGTMRLVERRGAPLDPDDGRVDADGEWITFGDESFPGSDEEGPLYAQGLSADPQTLVAQLFPDLQACPSLALCVATETRQLHGTYVVPSRVRAALWAALADTEGVWFLGHATDRLGRSAVAFAVDEGTDRQLVLYADEDTGAYLGSEFVLIQDSEQLGLEAPAVISFTALLEARWIATDQLPPS